MAEYKKLHTLPRQCSVAKTDVRTLPRTKQYRAQKPTRKHSRRRFSKSKIATELPKQPWHNLHKPTPKKHLPYKARITEHSKTKSRNLRQKMQGKTARWRHQKCTAQPLDGSISRAPFHPPLLLAEPTPSYVSAPKLGRGQMAVNSRFFALDLSKI